MKTPAGVLLWGCMVLAACAVHAAPAPAICGEWTGVRSAEESSGPGGQKWILTFFQDQSFTLNIVEAATPTPVIEGGYKLSESNLVLQLPDRPAVTTVYAVQGKELRIRFSEFVAMLGWGNGVEAFVRTKSASELNPLARERVMQEGQYKLMVRLSKNNDADVVQEIFARNPAEVLAEPIEAGPFPLRNLQGRNIIQLPSSRFGPAEFSGATFKVFGAIAPRVKVDFSGIVTSTNAIKGTFKSRASGLYGTFTLERVGGFE